VDIQHERGSSHSSARKKRGPARPPAELNDQIVELKSPGLGILLYAPEALAELVPGSDYSVRFPDDKDLVDYVNECRIGAFGTRWPTRDYWLHVSASFNERVIARAQDHVRFGVAVSGGQLCVRGTDDLFAWRARCPEEQIVTLPDGIYAVTACIVSHETMTTSRKKRIDPVRIYLHFARATATPDLGYFEVPVLRGEPPVR
jgi:hypothetical protein